MGFKSRGGVKAFKPHDDKKSTFCNQQRHVECIQRARRNNGVPILSNNTYWGNQACVCHCHYDNPCIVELDEKGKGILAGQERCANVGSHLFRDDFKQSPVELARDIMACERCQQVFVVKTVLE